MVASRSQHWRPRATASGTHFSRLTRLRGSPCQWHPAEERERQQIQDIDSAIRGFAMTVLDGKATVGRPVMPIRQPNGFVFNANSPRGPGWDNSLPSTPPDEFFPYQNGRPPYGPGQVKDVWDAGKGADGRVYDPNTGRELFWNGGSRKGQWDMGHLPENKYEHLHREYSSGNISIGELKRQVQNSSNYRPEGVPENRGHQFE